MTDPSRTHDVRMRGFRSRQPVAEVLRWLTRQQRDLGSERVRLDQACGRVLAAPFHAPLDIPAFDRSAMDGYAVQAEQTDGASLYNPLPFTVVGESLPGRPCDASVERQRAVRIMTGAPMPPGANAVVPAEYVTEERGESGQRIEITTSVPPGKHVGRRGEDVTCGEQILERGRRLRPQDIGMLAACGLADVAVRIRPRVRILVTGDELVEAGQARGPTQIYDANSPMLAALIHRDGGVVERRVHVRDSAEQIRQAMTEHGADIVLVSGGSSVGVEDHAPGVLKACGTLDVHGIAMRPSSPAGMGTLDQALVFLLPGNPVSCLCAYDFFAGRAIRQLAGRPADWPYRNARLTLAQKIVSAIGRVDYCRVQLEENGHIRPLATSGASILSSTTRAAGFVIVPAESEGLPPGAQATVYFYDFSDSELPAPG